MFSPHRASSAPAQRTGAAQPDGRSRTPVERKPFGPTISEPAIAGRTPAPGEPDWPGSPRERS